MANVIKEHNQPAAALWTQGGAAYDYISFQISDALAHAAQRLWPHADHRVLDVATGTGWTARNVARWAQSVTAVDIAEDLLLAAQELSKHMSPALDFQLADAEDLPFATGTFDRVISTFGVMFAGHHNSAARELGRVCKPGGRLVLATWDPAGSVAEFFAINAKHSGAPPPPMSPMSWGDPEYVAKLLGEDFELQFERGISRCYYPHADAVWNVYTTGFGPVRALANRLQGDALAAYKEEFLAYNNKSRTPVGLALERPYLLVIGTRK